MTWLHIFLILGFLTPLFLSPTAIKIAFEERDLKTALGVWIGQSVFTVPLMLLIGWIGSLFLY